MNRAGQMVFGEFAFFAHVNQNELVAAIHATFDLVNIGLADAGLRVINDLQESGRMLLSHENSFVGTWYQAGPRKASPPLWGRPHPAAPRRVFALALSHA
jgi:hypothetical protein